MKDFKNIPNKELKKAKILAEEELKNRFGEYFFKKYIKFDFNYDYILKNNDIGGYFYIKNKKKKYENSEIVFKRDDLLFHDEFWIENNKIKYFPEISFKRNKTQDIKLWTDKEAANKIINYLKSNNYKFIHHNKDEILKKLNSQQYKSSFVFLQKKQKFYWRFVFEKKDDLPEERKNNKINMNCCCFIKFLTNDIINIDVSGEKDILVNYKSKRVGKYSSIIPDSIEKRKVNSLVKFLSKFKTFRRIYLLVQIRKLRKDLTIKPKI